MNIHTLDLNYQNRPHTIASYLIEAPAGPILIETGPGSTLPTLLTRLAEHGLQPTDIKHVLVTHIHFDHAGAAGWWAQQGAQLYVHRVGAPHLINPVKLLASAKRIYQDDMERLWGDILPAPVSQVTHLRDRETLEIAGLPITPIDTAGHAWHHHTYRIGDIGFTGDAAGVRLPSSPFITLPAPPPEFKLDRWLQTLDDLEAENFSAIYPTHFGRVDDVATHLAQFRQLLLDATAFIKEGMAQGLDRDTLVEHYVAWNGERMKKLGMTTAQFEQFNIANPFFMSVDGIMRYWAREAKKRQAE